MLGGTHRSFPAPAATLVPTLMTCTTDAFLAHKGTTAQTRPLARPCAKRDTIVQQERPRAQSVPLGRSARRRFRYHRPVVLAHTRRGMPMKRTHLSRLVITLEKGPRTSSIWCLLQDKRGCAYTHCQVCDHDNESSCIVMGHLQQKTGAGLALHTAT